MFTLKVCKLPDSKYAMNNILTHNIKNFGLKPIYLKITNNNLSTVYKSIPADTIENTLGFSIVHRTKYNLQLDESINVSVYNPKQSYIKTLYISIRPGKQLNSIIHIHEDEFINKIKNDYYDYYFYNDQVLIKEIYGTILLLDIKTNSTFSTLCGEGFINTNTSIILTSVDYNINIISPKLLKRELFMDEFSFEDIGIGGLDDQLKNIFRRALSTRAIPPSLITKLGIKHVKGMLLYGPPGTGKTLIARNIGNILTNKPPKIVNGPEILNSYVGNSEAAIRALFADARNDFEENGDNSELHIIIFDEIDAICKARGRNGSMSGVNDTIVNQLLTMIDGPKQLNNIFVIAMTNRKDLLDEALLRAGRLEINIPITLPNLEGRKQIFRIHTTKMRTNNMVVTDLDIDKLAELTDNFSGAEIEAVVKNASSFAIHSKLKSTSNQIKDGDIVINMEDFMKAINEIEPSFGNSSKYIEKLLPEKFVMLSQNYNQCYNDLMDYISKKNRLKTILISGKNGVGKSTLAFKTTLDSKVMYTRIIRPIDIVLMDDFQKSQYIVDIFKDGYISTNSLIIIDDIEVVLNFTRVDMNISFSNKMYQTLLTVLKTQPENRSHTMNIIVTCTNEYLKDILFNLFDINIEIEELKLNDIQHIDNELGLNLDYDLILGKPYTIKELIDF